ncbi:DUF3299 domain-containing protein [Arcicella aquatica]|uniref:DUF3299 domain-containing protein n=1 Tax=Arcicella aquatica TaxID=217141 RepID=A0ABU5QIK8_9BACT|nr:DUF3299 domain-containing protein [Arcicella aquatica]MEA5256679.1 DUF3299 domain-containing protein [Arcicella aquatica]
MGKQIIIIAMLLAGIQLATAQGFDTKRITWNDLKDVRFKKRLNIELGMFFLYPTFGPKVAVLDGRELIIKGYTIPIDTEGTFVVSQNPMAMCFFCGKAGPESMIQLKFAKAHHFKTDEIHSFKGRLRLNTNNVNELNYILEDVEIED